MVRFDGGLLAALLTGTARTGESLVPGAQVDGVAVVEPWEGTMMRLAFRGLYPTNVGHVGSPFARRPDTSPAILPHIGRVQAPPF